MSKISVVFTLTGDQVKCGLCRDSLSYNRSSTSNMMRHLRTKHMGVNLSKRKRVDDEEIDDPSTDTTEPTSSSNVAVNSQICVSNQIPGPSTYSDPVARPVQFQSNITRYIPKPVGAVKRNIIDQQLLKMIVKEYYPFSIVEDSEFVKLLNILNPGYTLPSRKTLTKSRLPIMYNEIYDKVKHDIYANANYVSLTTDSWTSVKNENYTAVTTHFINRDCELKSYLLSCFKYSESHTSENLKNELIRVVTEWGLENKVAACTSDNAANIVGGVILCNWRHIGCFAHSLNLVVQHALKQIQEVRDKIKGIVGHFKRSSQAAARLQLRQEQLQFNPTLTVIQDVVTRWNSTYDMFERILHLKNPLMSALVDSKYDVYLSPSDWQLISDIFTTLNFLATGSYQSPIGNSKFMVLSQPTVSRCICEVVAALNLPEIFQGWVRFPKNMSELSEIRNDFYKETGFPGIIGCVDCTHVAIVPPSTNLNLNENQYPEYIYVNRK
ncbi:E3 SUMO-protein ligase ZBED1-like, partial [Aphis gossypii]|uniref:E3 SUMO-protein ligase ZBED1-like n=1 Tax=Aphis gossypii TaxID=80765 RepID=UPI002159A5CC